MILIIKVKPVSIFDLHACDWISVTEYKPQKYENNCHKKLNAYYWGCVKIVTWSGLSFCCRVKKWPLSKASGWVCASEKVLECIAKSELGDESFCL